MTKAVATNKKINSPAHFGLVLGAIDFERLAGLNKSIPLMAKAVLYCADKGNVGDYSESFPGVVREDAGKIILPKGDLNFMGRVENRPVRIGLGTRETTLELMANPSLPKSYQFFIRGYPEDGYESIKLFRDYVIPALAKKDSLHYNPNHNSSALFFLSHSETGDERAMLVVSSSLEVLADSVGKIKVFTEKDIQRFRNIGKKAKAV